MANSDFSVDEQSGIKILLAYNLVNEKSSEDKKFVLDYKTTKGEPRQLYSSWL